MSITIPNGKQAIAKNFSRNAGNYDQNARIQKHAAVRLSEYLEPLTLQPGSTILEIGCGTGFISELLIGLFPESSVIISDISKEMLSQCRNNLVKKEVNLENVYFQVLDGESIDSFNRYDVIVSGLTAQWFDNFPAWLEKALTTMAPGAKMFLSYLSDKSFPEWKDTCRQLGIPFTGNSLPDPDLLGTVSKNKDIRCLWETEYKTEVYDSILHFFAELKLIGASTRPTLNAESLTLSMLRKLNQFHSNGRECDISHHIVYGIISC